METKVAVIVPNWNGADFIVPCLKSLEQQSLKPSIIVVDNGSQDSSVQIMKSKFKNIELLEFLDNAGFAGGVNRGIKKAIKDKYEFVALFNNDAVADKNWLKNLVLAAGKHKKVGIITGKLMSANKKHIDSTGDLYSTWGLPFPRGRDQLDKGQFNKPGFVFGASGGASLYKTTMLKTIGLFDEDFFAYYEDVDISFRAQLAGWKVWYEPEAIAYHATGSTSKNIKGFATYQTFKNQPLLLIKNIPDKLMLKILPRFMLAYLSISLSSLIGRRSWPAFKGFCVMLYLLPKKLKERRSIKNSSQTDTKYIESILIDDLPPNATKLRKLRKVFTGKN